MSRLLCLIALLPSLAAPCLNDRDTLGFELHNRPEVQKALTGWFDRYPPLYYQMRIDRLSHKGRLSPDEYDDLAVAFARLGRNREGLAALARKARLSGLSSMDRYRLYANRGTLEAHQYIQDGAKQSDLPLLRRAERDIASAILLNSKAHFGREGTQLEVIRWLISLKTSPDSTDSLGGWVVNHLKDGDPVAGLSGLVMLGGAWESPDVALAIGYAAGEGAMGAEAVPDLAAHRYKELLRLGKKPLSADLAAKMLEHVVPLQNYLPLDEALPPLGSRFLVLRKQADERMAGKTTYMLALLKAGRHPDTDPSFWADWHEPAMPVLPTKNQAYVDRMHASLVAAVLTFCGAPVFFVGLIVWMIVRLQRRGNARAS